MWVLTAVRYYDVYAVEWVSLETDAERDMREIELGEHTAQWGYSFRPTVTWNIYPVPHLEYWRFLEFEPKREYLISCSLGLHEDQSIRGEDVQAFLAVNWCDGDCIKLWHMDDSIEVQHYEELA